MEKEEKVGLVGKGGMDKEGGMAEAAASEQQVIIFITFMYYFYKFTLNAYQGPRIYKAFPSSLPSSSLCLFIFIDK